MTSKQLHISRNNRANAWKHFWPKGNGKAKAGYVLHHKDPSWKTSDIERYIEWNVDDLVMMSRKEHFKLHGVPGWNKDTKMESSPLKGKTLEEYYGIEKAKQMKAKISAAMSGEKNHNFGKPNWNSGLKMPVEMYESRSKKIAQYTLDGKLVATYKSIRDAERQTGFAHNNISICANGKSAQMYGYVWKFTTEE